MIFGMMRVKNEEKYLARALKPLVEVCDSVFILDDHSRDNTVDIIRSTERCISIGSPFTGLNEARDKTFLLDFIVRSQLEKKDLTPDSPHWVICVDGDEEICWSDIGKLVLTDPRHNISYSFQILTLYDAPDQIRVDGPYAKLLRPSMFRLIKPGMVFKSTAQHGGGLHCSNVPADIGFAVRTHEPEPVRVKHYGYMKKEAREKKYKFYVENDPGYESWYRGECFGGPGLAALPEEL